MSTVTGVVLITGCTEPDDLFNRIDGWLISKGREPLGVLEEHAITGKHPEIYIRGGGYNYLENEAFAHFVMSLEWESPESVVLILKRHEDQAVVYRPKGYPL